MLLRYLSFKIIQKFLNNIYNFLFINEFSYFLLFFSCCPAELESVEIFEIPLSVFELQYVKNNFLKIILNLTLKKNFGFFGLNIL